MMASPMQPAVGTGWRRQGRLECAVDLAIIGAATGFIIYHLRPDLLLLKTTAAGGDTASFVHLAAYLHDKLLPQGRVIGWEPGGYAGYALFQFYSLLPFLAIALLGFMVPLEVAFKLVTVLGPVTLPLGAFLGLRLLGCRFPVPAIGSFAMLPFLFQEGNSMWGGNILSVLAGEFSHAIGLSLWLVFVGLCGVASEGGKRWVGAGLLLATIGLTHAFAFVPALWVAAFYLAIPGGISRRSGPLFKIGLLAFLLMAFWAVPLVAKVHYTTQFSVEWHIKSWQEIFPKLLWVPLGLAVIRLLAAAVLRGGWADRTAACFSWMIGGAVVAFYAAPSVGFPDIRFIPVIQIMVCLLAADLVGRVMSKLAAPAPAALALCAITIWVADNSVKNLPAWVKWNYEGFERKVAWPTFKAINEFLKGDYSDPRVAYENAPEYDRFGSMRAFESLPRFSGRATLEGVLFQTPTVSPFVFFLQSEISKKPSNPFPQYSYSKINAEAATAHFKLFNVSHVIGISQEFEAAFSDHPEYSLVFRRGRIKVFRLDTSPRAYVEALDFEPVLFDTDDWKRDFFRWYKHPERLAVFLSPRSEVPGSDWSLFKVGGGDLSQLPRLAIAGECKVEEKILEAGISFTTSCPGRPHLIKMSYFPNWRADGARGPFLVSPAFMLVFPQGKEVRLYYASTPADLLGGLLSCLGLIVALVASFSPFRLRERIGRERISTLLVFLEERRALLVTASLAVIVLATCASVWQRRETARASAKAHSAFDQKDLERAVKLFASIVAGDDNSPRTRDGRLYLGFSYYRKQDFNKTREVFEEYLEIYPESPRVPEVTYHIAMSERGLGQVRKAVETFLSLIKKHPDTPWAGYARQRLKEMNVSGLEASR